MFSDQNSFSRELAKTLFAPLLTSKYIDSLNVAVFNPPWRIHATARDVIRFASRPVQSAAVTGGLFAAGIVDQDAPHGLGGGREEMSPALPSLTGIALHAQAGLMDQGSGLEHLAGAFLGQQAGSQMAQLLVKL
jgi:hypothetical protein